MGPADALPKVAGLKKAENHFDAIVREMMEKHENTNREMIAEWADFDRDRMDGCGGIKQEAVIKNEDINQETEVQVGYRVQCADFFGIVKYIGPVEGMHGMWIGVEWDDPSRGKHDGSYCGTRYFKTLHPSSGSFVRATKLAKPRSAEEAIHLQYCPDEELKLFTRQEFGARFLEFVGMDKVAKKQKNLEQLRIADLSGLQVSHGKLSPIVPRLRELNLSLNLFRSWDQVVQVVEDLQHLSTLILSGNRLQTPQVTLSDFEVCLPLSLVTLVMSGCDLTWTDVLFVGKMCPNLKSLQIPNNNIIYMDMVQDMDLNSLFPHLEDLNLEGNELKDEHLFARLGGLERLTSLNLSRTQIQDLPIAPPMFQSLKFLCLAKNNISTWESIDKLCELKNLESLVFYGNPVCQLQSEENTRQEIIARISSLTSLNRSEIPKKERAGAEIDYLKRYGKLWFGDREHLLRLHPTYRRLVEAYGPPEESELSSRQHRVRDTLVTLRIVTPLHPPDRPVTKRVPVTMTVQSLRNLVGRLVRRPAYALTLVLQSSHNPNVKEKLDKDQEELDFYSVESDDFLIVSW
ncbi:unnamed protein product [Darwinula stevensoni]|uniref:Tubulin-specific chaperone E n=1 Tax=Darwinula stevensoni TaxID=69355 RepID=A0A7R8X8J2_9CRUS|nr:unnamed protein product [Darwinula stevensoni]CAG0887984.1 unnamed protein product [Darwinula stevensoni]